MYTLVVRHLSRVHLSRANFLYSHNLRDAQLTWNKIIIVACETGNVANADKWKMAFAILVSEKFEKINWAALLSI